MDGARFNKNVKPQTDWQGRVTGYKAERIFPDIASASRGQDELDAINPAGFTPFGRAGEPQDPPEVPAYPPNCDGNARYGQEPTQAGQVLAQAQHEAAEDGEGCGSVACAMTRGVND